MNFDQIDLDLMRPTWRSIPPECKSKHPDLISRVYLTPDGPKVGVFRHDRLFVTDPDRANLSFDKLKVAEDAAVRLLAADHDAAEDWQMTEDIIRQPQN